MIDLSQDQLVEDGEKQVQSAQQDNLNMSDNLTENNKKANHNLDQVETNPIDDVEQLLKQIEEQERQPVDDELENEGNLTRLVDRI